METRYGGGFHTCSKCGQKVFGSKIHRCDKDYFASVRKAITKATENSGYTIHISEEAKIKPVDKLEIYYKQYLEEKDLFIDFKDWLGKTDLYNYLKLAMECGFSTTSEVRKEVKNLDEKYSNPQYKSAGFVIWFRFKSLESKVVGTVITKELEMKWTKWIMYWNKKVYDDYATAQGAIENIKNSTTTEMEFEIREIFYCI